jgi:hypothetical protein
MNYLCPEPGEPPRTYRRLTTKERTLRIREIGTNDPNYSRSISKYSTRTNKLIKEYPDAYLAAISVCPSRPINPSYIISCALGELPKYAGYVWKFT